MASYQGAVFLWTWNGGVIDGLTVANNTIYWNPFENAPALLNRADIKGKATFQSNTIASTAPKMVESNTAMSLAGNTYRYFGSGTPEWTYGGKSFGSMHDLQENAKQESAGHFEQMPLKDWPHVFVQRHAAEPEWVLDCMLPIALGADHLMSDSALQEIVVLKSFRQQYAPQGLQVHIEMTSTDPAIFQSEAFRNALTDLDLHGIKLTHRAVAAASPRVTLRGPDGTVAEEWKELVGPVPLGLALRNVFGEPIYAQMDGSVHE
jgi:hypothetical protein